MTLTAPTFPLTETEALTHLKDALGEGYGGPTDETTLLRALSVDGVSVVAVFHARPFATAYRLIKFNTEYEVDKNLKARIDRKLGQLLVQQRQMDALAGILAFLPDTTDLSFGQSGSFAVRTEGVF